MHSQRLNKDPLSAWLISKDSGEILCGHCNCMAGLGEVCTHVAAILFWIEITVKIRCKKTVTDTAAYWVAPSKTNVEPKRIEEIDFRSTKKKKIQVEQVLDEADCLQTKKKKTNVVIPTPTENELNIFYRALNNCPKSFIEDFRGSFYPISADEYKPKSLESPIPMLSELYQ